MSRVPAGLRVNSRNISWLLPHTTQSTLRGKEVLVEELVPAINQLQFYATLTEISPWVFEEKLRVDQYSALPHLGSSST
jgi:hypothetical protein